jgi:hypothetical protein
VIPFFFVSLFFALLAACLAESIPARTRSFMKGAIIGMPLSIAVWLVLIGIVWRACK